MESSRSGVRFGLGRESSLKPPEGRDEEREIEADMSFKNMATGSGTDDDVDGDPEIPNVIRLMYMAKDGNVDGIMDLLNSGTDVNFADIDGRTALHVAACQNFVDVVELLLIQCILTAKPDVVSKQMVKFAAGISRESIVDVEGVVSVPEKPITGASQQVEIQVRKIYCISRAIPNLPINIEDASRSEIDFEKADKMGEKLVRVGQDTRLNYRVLDVRTPANQGIFRIQCQVENTFRQFMLSEGFVGIHTPKLIAGSSEGGSAVFKLDYKGQSACLAQSPQLHKQISICGDFGRVFEVGPVFRAEDSFTHRHLCEFVGLDAEMEIKEHYSEVMDIVGRLFVSLFDSLNEKLQKELDAVNMQYPLSHCSI